MPYCTECAKYWTPNTMESDGSCPRCGRILAVPTHQDDDRARLPITAANLDLKALASGENGVDPRAPWHFKLLVVGLVVYLGWRLVDLFV